MIAVCVGECGLEVLLCVGHRKSRQAYFLKNIRCFANNQSVISRKSSVFIILYLLCEAFGIIIIFFFLLPDLRLYPAFL